MAKELRRLRRESGKTREQVADFVGCSPVTITRIESAQTAGTVPIVARMLEAYGIAGDEHEAFLKLCREARKRGWWQRYSDSIPEWFQVYVGIEEEAASLRIYEAEVVPGLLQTESYATATYLAEPVILEEAEIQRRVALRMQRQQRLFEAGDTPSMWVVLSEAAVRRQVGGVEVMKEQLLHLDQLSRRPNVMLQVLPFTAGAHPGMQGGFTILAFPEAMDPNVVYVEYRQGGLYLEGHDEVEAYKVMYNHLCAQALGREETRAFITRVADGLR
ncbi:helix-turn-helix domain-containing protein [Thermomonospora umbrina]|nr:helix-turn-helix transcriptional regulator [Thermomonospora umbrina]